MITEINIQNFVLFQNESIVLNNNSNSIIGDSASGKSLIFKALRITLGLEKWNNSFSISKNKPTIFSISIKKNNNLKNDFTNNDIPLLDNNIFRKSFNKKFSHYINDIKVSQDKFEYILNNQISFLSQNSQNKIFESDYILTAIDNNIPNILDNYLKIYKRYLLKKQKLDQIKKELLKKDDELFMLESKKEKLTILDRETFNFLNTNLHIIENYKESQEIDNKLNYLLYDADTSLQSIFAELWKITKKLNLSDDILNQFRKAESFFDNFKENINFELITDEDQMMYYLSNIENFKKVKKVYDNFDLLLNDIDNINDRIEYLNNLDHYYEDITSEIESIKKQLSNEMVIVKKERNKFINKIKKHIIQDMQMMHVPYFNIDFEEESVDFYEKGNYKIFIKIITNKGKELDRIQNIASGGEVSRFLLSFFKNTNFKNILLLDEADTGLSGDIAISLGKMLKDLAKNNQIICITHLIQVAFFSKNLFFVKKDYKKDNTYSQIKSVDKNEKEKYLLTLLSSKINNFEILNSLKKEL